MRAEIGMQHRNSLALLSVVFFSWGLLTSANTILVPYFQQQFGLGYQQSMLVQLAFYLAPFMVCVPTSVWMSRRGYKTTLQGALTITALGCISLFASLWAEWFYAALAAVFGVAMGVASLQVVANPYVTQSGQERDATRRLTIASTLNSLGTTSGPLLLGVAMLTLGIGNIYLLFCLALVVLVGVIYRSSLTDFRTTTPVDIRRHLAELTRQRGFMLGAATIFVYVGVEVSIGTVTISYLAQFGGLSSAAAASFISFYWAGSLAGRMLYSLVAGRIGALKVLLCGAGVALALVLYAIINPSFYGGIALILVGLCNSFMYPIIFSRAIDGLGQASGAGSAILIMCGVGGGVIPMVQAQMASEFGLSFSYFVPICGYLLIAFYAFSQIPKRIIQTA